MGLRVWGVDAPRQPAKGIWSKVPQWERDAARGVVGNYGYAVSDSLTPLAMDPIHDGAVSDLLRAHKVWTPHLVFTGSLMDWAEDRPDLVPLRERLWQVIRECPHLWFQLLTKRPENIGKFLPPDWGPNGFGNVWLGTTIEDNRVKVRAQHLTSNPARVHFISYEPAIGPLDEVDLTHIEWLIFGGESGPGYRKHDPQWARDIRDRCVAAGIAYFHKQDSAMRTETNPFLVEVDGTKWAWKQYPGKLVPPVQICD